MIKFIISENHDVINMLMADPQHLLGPGLAHSENNVLLINMTFDNYQSLFKFDNNNQFEAFYDETYYLKKTKYSLKNIEQLLDDIERLPLIPGSALYILSEENLFFTDFEIKLPQALARLRNWLDRSKLSIHFCIFGTRINSHLIPILNANFNRIESASTIAASTNNQYRYKILYTHSKKGITTNAGYYFTPGISAFTPVNEEKQVLGGYDTHQTSNHDKVLTLTTLLREMETAPAQFQFFDTYEQLSQAASTRHYATIAIPCLTYDDIEPISRLSYQLRSTVGSQLKLIVREVTKCISYCDERLLLDSGVNLIVPAELSLSQFLSQTTAIQNQVYTRQLPSQYEKLQSLRPSCNFSGLTGIEQFTHHVKSLVSKQLNLAMDFALIRLDLYPNMDIKDCMSLCNLRRDGDLLSPCKNSVYVFLSAVRTNDVTVALNGIFDLKINELFASHKIWSNAADIIEELENAHKAAIPFTKELRAEIKQISSTDYEITAQQSQTRSYAKRVPLEHKSQKVLP